MSNNTNSSGDFPDQYNSAGSSEPSAINGVPSDSLGAGRGEVKSNHAVTPDSHEDTVGYSDVGMGPAALPEEPPVGKEDEADPIDGSEPEEAPPVLPDIDEDDDGEEEDYGESREDDESDDEGDLVGAGISGEAKAEGTAGNGAVDATASASVDDRAAANTAAAAATDGGASGDASSQEAVASAGAGVAPANEVPQLPKVGSTELRSVIESSAAFFPPVDPAGTLPPDGASDEDVIEQPEPLMPEIVRDVEFRSGGAFRVGLDLSKLTQLLAWLFLWFVCRRTRQVLYVDRLDGKDKIVPVTEDTAPIFVARSFQLRVDDGKKRFRLLNRAETRLLLRTRHKYGLPVVAFHGEGFVYDDKCRLFNQVGYYPKHKVLVVGTPVVPQNGTTVLDELLSEIAFKDNAARTNLIGAMIGHVLFNRVGISPILLLVANYPGVGKTLVLRFLAAIFDGEEPPMVSYTSNDAELEKRVGAVVLLSTHVLGIDNAKPDRNGEIQSQAVERMTTSIIITSRLLGTSKLITRLNDIIWCLTANQPKLSRDLVARSLVVEMEFPGDPSKRSFKFDDLIAAACSQRVQAQGELVGMIERWKAAGCPLSNVNHRYGPWAKVVGGVLEANGLTGFLQNDLSAKVSIDNELGELVEALGGVVGRESFTSGELLQEVEARKLLPAIRAMTTLRGRQTRLGAMLSAIVGQEIRTTDTIILVTHVGAGDKVTRYKVTIRPIE